MGYTQQNGDIDGISTPLYWRIGAQHSIGETVQEHVVDQNGNKLDIEGNIVPMVNGQYPAEVVFAYQFAKIVNWTVVFYAYLSRDESDEWEKMQKPPRKTQVFLFKERKDSMAALLGSAIAGLYNHPLLQAQIPADWIADNQ